MRSNRPCTGVCTHCMHASSCAVTLEDKKTSRRQKDNFVCIEYRDYACLILVMVCAQKRTMMHLCRTLGQKWGGTDATHWAFTWHFTVPSRASKHLQWSKHPPQLSPKVMHRGQVVSYILSIYSSLYRITPAIPTAV